MAPRMVNNASARSRDANKKKRRHQQGGARTYIQNNRIGVDKVAYEKRKEKSRHRQGRNSSGTTLLHC